MESSEEYKLFCKIIDEYEQKSPVIPEKDPETVAQFLERLSSVQQETVEIVPNISDTIAKMKRKESTEKKIRKIEKRLGRSLGEGSYSQFSVDERKLRGKSKEILRLTWKGKFEKLRAYLKDIRNQRFINRRDYWSRTALHYAASWGCQRTMQLLLETPGIDVNIRDADGKTPLRKACENNNLTCAKLLVESGALIQVTADDNRNPFEYVLQELGDDGIELAVFLYRKSPIRDGALSYLHQVCLSNVKSVILAEELIKAGAVVNATEGNGCTPLILAAMMDDAELVKLFIKEGADVNHVDLTNCNALDYSATGSECHRLISDSMTEKFK